MRVEIDWMEGFGNDPTFQVSDVTMPDRLEAIVERFDPYMGDNECRPMENARSTIAALRERLSKGA